MEAFRDEREQVEALKRFWRDNGKSLIAGILIGLALLFSWKAWEQNRTAKAEGASMEYMGMMDNLAQGNHDAAIEHGGRIVRDYPDTSYAALASLALAKLKLDKGDGVAARAHLKWTIANTRNDHIAQIARLRLAKLLLSEKDAEQALSVLKEVDREGYASLYNEIEGDIHSLLGNTDQAVAAYSAALKGLDENAGGRLNLLKMKLDNLGGDSTKVLASK